MVIAVELTWHCWLNAIVSPTNCDGRSVGCFQNSIIPSYLLSRSTHLLERLYPHRLSPLPFEALAVLNLIHAPATHLFPAGPYQ